jgi:hypothetical protein
MLIRFIDEIYKKFYIKITCNIIDLKYDEILSTYKNTSDDGYLGYMTSFRSIK